MSLSSGLFTGTSGLKNMGNSMQVTGNNIANVNTIGYKKGRATFADTLYESVATQAGADQVGRGMAVGSVSQNFDQGSFESTGQTTDLSIGGEGFFIMRQSGTENYFYTRAGNFYFDKDGQLINPEGYVVQGWELDSDTGDDIGSIKDIVLAAFTNPPEKSTEITAVTNLDADIGSQAVVLSNVWDSSATNYISTGNYEYATTVKAYDALGSTHDITIYYDKKSGTEWEYMITCNPEEDNRNLVQNTDSKGLLARGSITFSQSSGDILDFTMSEFTGRLGNFTANGVNTVDDVDYEIVDYDDLALDGYGFSFEFDGTSWEFTDSNGDSTITPADKPENYTTATIVYSDNQNIWLNFSGTDTDPDLKIQLSSPAVATDSLGFDINNKNDLHIQGIEGTTYSGDTANDNTTLQINNPSVMDQDTENTLGIIWNPNAETWYWSNPISADSAGTLVTNVTTTSGLSTSTSASVNITNVGDLTMVASGIDVRYDARTGTWDWNQGIKTEDFANETFTFSPSNDPVLSIITQGTQGAMASASASGTTTSITLTWDGSAWGSTNGNGTTGLVVDTANSDNTQVQLSLWERDDLAAGYSAGMSTIRYTFGSTLTTVAGQTIDFNIDPTPPREYANAELSSAGTYTSGVSIDFDQDSILDLEFNVTAGGTAVANYMNYTFDVDPDEPPIEYVDATLKGDQSEAVIDLDGSGNETDKDDIVFSFEDSLKYGSSTHAFNDRSVISFDIKGSTAWTEISKESIKTTGYYSFTADFLGGEFGSTEQDLKFDIGTKYDGTNFINDSLATTQYSKSSTTIFQDADGYAAGDLQGVDVASDGIITGVYSNGQLIPLFRVGLAKFLNNYGLSNEGGNLFSETRDSGSAITNKPGENGLGTLSPNSLELSNVDISEEFVNLITTQRGFQANSKTVTTIDDMMQTVIQMKR